MNPRCRAPRRWRRRRPASRSPRSPPSWRSATRSTRSNDITGVDAGLVRADDRLCRHQDPALRLREVQGRRAFAVDGDEVGRRGDGDRPHLPREPAEGAARPGDRPDGLDEVEARALRRAAGRRSRRRSPGRRPTACWSPPRRFARASPSTRSTRSPLRPLVPRAARRDRRGGGSEVASEGLPQRRRRHAAAEGDGLLRPAPRRAGASLGDRKTALATASSTTRSRR
jgi:hypothetical protein